MDPSSDVDNKQYWNLLKIFAQPYKNFRKIGFLILITFSDSARDSSFCKVPKFVSLTGKISVYFM